MKDIANIHLVVHLGYFGFRAANYEVTYDIRNDKVEPPHQPIYNKCLAKLRKIGFTVTKDPEIEKHYACLSKTHRFAQWHDLQAKIKIYPTGFELHFFQKGNEHGHNKEMKMPYLMRKAILYTTAQLDAVIASCVPVTRSCMDQPKMAVDHLLHHFQNSSFTRNKIVSVDEIEGMMSEYDHKQNSFDKDKNIIKCGQVKYFRDYDGRLRRGTAYHNINNMWWVILDKFTLRNIGSSQLFYPTPGDFAVRRLKPGKIPQERQQQLDLLNSLSLPQLQKALAKRAKSAKQAA
jgi:hypothetical protein